ncbi:recombinase family protein [Microbispora rosea]|uniref:recombinase family protein n=1 Tax=Microbispora rosea TaxID=58117 RepID=UPI0036AEEB39
MSIGGQSLKRQLDALNAAECQRILAEKKSGKDTDRPELAAALAFMQPGDTLIVPSLDRLSRSLQDLLRVADLRRREVTSPPCMRASTPPPAGAWSFTSSPPWPKFIRHLISGTREGLAAARSRIGGRPRWSLRTSFGSDGTCCPSLTTVR